MNDTSKGCQHALYKRTVFSCNLIGSHVKLELCCAEMLEASSWVLGSLYRDQDVRVNMTVLEDALTRIALLNHSREAFQFAEAQNPNITALWQL